MNHYTPQQVADILEQHTLNATRHREAQRAYYERKKDERRAYARMYYATHREAVLDRMRRYNHPPATQVQQDGATA